MVVTDTDLIRAAKNRGQLKTIMNNIIANTKYERNLKSKAVRTMLLSEAKKKLHAFYETEISAALSKNSLASLIREITADDLLENKTKLLAIAKVKASCI